MARRTARDPIYSGRRFSTETIETCVRWYITYRLSYRDLVAMMAEQGIVVSHTTIMRWVLRYVPEYERRWSRFARSPGSSWRMDETAVSVALYRHDGAAGEGLAGVHDGSISARYRHTYECRVGMMPECRRQDWREMRLAPPCATVACGGSHAHRVC